MSSFRIRMLLVNFDECPKSRGKFTTKGGMSQLWAECTLPFCSTRISQPNPDSLFIKEYVSGHKFLEGCRAVRYISLLYGARQAYSRLVSIIERATEALTFLAAHAGSGALSSLHFSTYNTNLACKHVTNNTSRISWLYFFNLSHIPNGLKHVQLHGPGIWKHSSSMRPLTSGCLERHSITIASVQNLT